MLKLVSFAVFISSVSLFVFSQNIYYEESAQKYTGNQGLWEAGYNEYFRGMSLERIKRMMGAKVDPDPDTSQKAIYGQSHSLPSFNSAEHWPNCASTITFIKDQSDCGSCWAVAASEIAADRTCIANVGSLPHMVGLNENGPLVDFSTEQLMSCCWWCGFGCYGGLPTLAMRYWCKHGLVTGGWYGSNCGCQPYKIPPNSLLVSGQDREARTHHTPDCSKTCRPDHPISFKNDRHFCTDHYKISNREKGIMNEIAKRGPVECLFTVYENFLHYKNGIYSEHHGIPIGGHAVKIVGWGTDPDGNKYWIVNNSWNITWGMNGVFWYKRGVNLCSMEAHCVAGTAKKGDSNFQLKC